MLIFGQLFDLPLRNIKLVHLELKVYIRIYCLIFNIVVQYMYKFG